MYTDAQLLLSDAQALTATALSTNVIDLGGVYAVGNGEQLGVLVTVDVAADQTTGDETYEFGLEVASDAAITTARQELAQRRFTAAATAPDQNVDLLVAGYSFVVQVPPVESLSEAARYMALRYTLGGTTPTITVTANLLPISMIDQGPEISYAAGYSIT